MTFNPSKCTTIRVSTGRRHKFQSTYMLHGQTLDVVDGSKYLGVTVTDNLSWSKHVSDTASKAHCSLGFLRRNFKHCSRQVKAATYTSVVRPVLEYAAPVWDPYRQADIKSREQVPSAKQLAMCTITIHRAHLDASQRWSTSLAGKAYRTDARSPDSAFSTKHIHSLVDIDKATYLKPGDSRTRSHTGFYQEHTAHEVYHNSFFPRTIREWNRLPNSVTSAPTVDGFRACLYTRLGPASYHFHHTCK